MGADPGFYRARSGMGWGGGLGAMNLRIDNSRQSRSSSGLAYP